MVIVVQIGTTPMLTSAHNRNMSDEGLYKLYKLHLIDSKLHQLKSRASALDVGNKEAAVFKKLQTESKPIRDQASDLSQKLTALQNRKIESSQKADTFEEKAYSGKVVSPRELEDLGAEIKMLRELVEKSENEIQELKPQVEAAESEAQIAIKHLAKLKKIVLEKQENAKVEHGELEKQYKDIKTQRTDREKQVDPSLLREYAAAIKKTGSTGVALITDDDRCEVCGIAVPSKTQEMVRLGKAIHCESCRRIYFKLMPNN